MFLKIPVRCYKSEVDIEAEKMGLENECEYRQATFRADHITGMMPSTDGKNTQIVTWCGECYESNVPYDDAVKAWEKATMQIITLN